MLEYMKTFSHVGPNFIEYLSKNNCSEDLMILECEDDSTFRAWRLNDMRYGI